MLKFESNLPQPNEILRGNNFYISYNPKTGENYASIDQLLIGFLASKLTGHENGKEETALYNRVNGVWYILNGDFRKEYEAVAHDGFTACLNVYKRNIQHRSDWSTDNADSRPS